MPSTSVSQRTFSVRFPQIVWETATTSLLSDISREAKGFFLCSTFELESSDYLIAQQFVETPPDAYESRSSTEIVIRPEYVHSLLCRCAEQDLALLEIHTHPWSKNVRFSSIDQASDPRKFAATELMSPPFRHGCLVLGKDHSLDGHLWDNKTHSLELLKEALVCKAPIQRVHGKRNMLLTDDLKEAYDRQVRMLGTEGQSVMSSAKVGIVGCGGLGSQLIQALTLLGVRDYVLIDPDNFEASNGNRVVGVPPSVVERGSPKVNALADSIQLLSQNQAQIVRMQSRIQDGDTWKLLAECDVLFGTVDSNSARQFLNRLSSALLIPFIDGGVGIRAENGAITSGGGQVQVIVPGFTACRSCLKSNTEVEEDQLLPGQIEANKRRGYISGADIINPQVVFLNGIIANLITWEAVKLLTGCAPIISYTYYDLLQGVAFQPAGTNRDPHCLVCSEDGWLGGGAQAITSLVSAWQSNVELPGFRERVLDG